MTPSQQKVQELLKNIESFSAHEYSHLAVVDSTNTRLKATLDDSVFVPRVLLADFQTSGRGQFDRSWFGKKKDCLMFSFTDSVDQIEFPLSLMAGIAAYMGIVRIGVAGQKLWLKWPNDIWAGQKKLGGILSESTYASRQFRYVIGVGVNLRPQRFDTFQKDVADIYTLGGNASAVDLMLAILASWNELLDLSAVQLCQKWTDCAAEFWQTPFNLVSGADTLAPVFPVKLCQDGTLIVKTDKKEISLRSGRLIPVFD